MTTRQTRRLPAVVVVCRSSTLFSRFCSCVCIIFVACRLGSCWQPGSRASANDSTKSTPAVSVRVSLGSNATLPCDFGDLGFSVSDELKVIWMRNTTTLTFNRESLRERRISIATSGSWLRYDLLIGDVRATDQGMYACMASYLGSYHKRIISLLVKVPPRINDALSSPESLVAAEGEQLALHCSADGFPKPSIAWFKRVNDAGLRHRNVALGTGPRYVVHNASRICEGIFLCRASNGEEPAAIREIRVVMHYRPRVSVVNEQISQSRGRSTMVMCAVSGLPMPEFFWEHRGRRFHPAEAGEVVGLDGCKRQRHCVYVASVDGARGLVQMDLLVSNLTAADFGVYQCVARSPLGEDRKAVHVLELQDRADPAEPHAPAPVSQEAAAAAAQAQPPSMQDADELGGGVRQATSRNAKSEAEGTRINRHSSGSLVTSSGSGGGDPASSAAAAAAAEAAAAPRCAALLAPAAWVLFASATALTWA